MKGRITVWWFLLMLIGMSGCLFVCSSCSSSDLLPQVTVGGTAVVQQANALQRVSDVQPDGYVVMGPPTITADFMNTVLAAYHSPAAGTGQSLYDLGVHYGIDPVYALAFFLHEDAFGTTGWGAVNHSLGNSRCSGWPTCQGGYRSYATWQEGYQDWYHLILYGYVQGQVTIPIVGHTCRTIPQIIPVYAPSSDGNNEAAYIRVVEHAVDVWRSGKVYVS